MLVLQRKSFALVLCVYIQRAIQLFSKIKYPHVDLSLKLKPNENVLIHFHLVGMFLFCIDVNFQVSFKASNHIAVCVGVLYMVPRLVRAVAN